MELAVRLDGEIINADSMQVYRMMDIGTAKPTNEERSKCPFHLLDLVRPDYQYTVSEWKLAAEKAIREVHSRGKQAIVCGGTGLYIKALLDNWSLAETPSNPEIRKALQKRAEVDGTSNLHEELKQSDLITATRLHPNDGIRIIRALEVFHITGKPISEHQAEDREKHPRRPSQLWGLCLPRPLLYARIEERVDEMMRSGLLEEVSSLIDMGFSSELTSMKSLGYKELTSHLQNETDLNEAISLIKQNTRRFAKRQQTWFRADSQISWIECSELSSAEIAVSLISTH